MILSSLEVAKLHAGIEPTENRFDALLSLTVQQAEDAIAKELDGSLIAKRDGIVEFYDGTGTNKIVLSKTPVRSVTEVREDHDGFYGQQAGSFPPESILTSGIDYALQLDDGDISRTGNLIRLVNFVWVPGKGNYKVTYNAGPLNTPNDMLLAIALQAVHMLRQAQAKISQGPVEALRLGELSVNFGKVLAAIGSDASLTAEVASLVGKRKRYWVA
jgi:hypothetical protein